MKKTPTFVVAAAVALALSAFAEESAEQKVTLDKIPAPAAQAIQKLSGGEKITSLSKETDEGKTVYEAQFKKGGRVHEVSVDTDGKLVSNESVIPVSEAPAAVQKAIEASAAGGKVEKLEKVEEHGKVTFEALISAKGTREEVVFSPDGKVVKRENKTGEKEND